MNKSTSVSVTRAVFFAAVSFCALSGSSAHAEQIKVEALAATTTETKLEFADGSKRYLLSIQREGKATGSVPLAGTTMHEWGTHDVSPGIGASGNGYLVFTAAPGDIAYIKYQFRATPVTGTDGKTRNLINGSWEVAGSAGKLKPLHGAGVLRVAVVSPTERLWTLEGELLRAP
ncbi:MAG: hypothetical protein ABIS68_08300 [Casimicrobiaceae bacterium]